MNRDFRDEWRVLGYQTGIMCRFFQFFITLGFFTGFANAAAPEVFSEIRPAIEAAKKDEKLIVFMLLKVKGFLIEAEPLEELILDELKDRGDEFVIVQCDAASAVHQKMFTDRFKKDLEKAPVVVVSNAKGEEITGCYGVNPKIYEKMLMVARIKGGKVTNEEELVALRIALVEDENEDELMESLFGVMLKDLKGKRVQLSNVRNWTYKKGGGFRAALLAGRGEIGVFINAEGEQIEVKFDELSKPDVEFLRTVLTEKKTEPKE